MRMTPERREYFRVHDRVILDFLPVSTSDIERGNLPPAYAGSTGYAVMRELIAIDQENSRLLHSIGLANRDLELYLRGLNRKIDLLANQLALDDETTAPRREVSVSLSEAGLAFGSHDPMKVDSHLAIQLTLLPNHVTLILFGKIVSCDANSGEAGYTVGCQFINISSSDQQILAKHIMQVQLKQKRQQQEDGQI